MFNQYPQIKDLFISTATTLALLSTVSCSIEESPQSSPATTARSDGFDGGCEPFEVFAQNRWVPYGAAIRQEPSRQSDQIGGILPNKPISVNGWIKTGTPTYPDNVPPFDNDVWYHLVGQAGWVSFGGVRGDKTENDPTRLSEDGGTPAPLEEACKGSYKK